MNHEVFLAYNILLILAAIYEFENIAILCIIDAFFRVNFHSEQHQYRPRSSEVLFHFRLNLQLANR